jgi:hypothetical protein
MQRMQAVLAGPQHAALPRHRAAPIDPGDRRPVYRSRRKNPVYRTICELFLVIIVQNKPAAAADIGRAAARAQLIALRNVRFWG